MFCIVCFTQVTEVFQQTIEEKIENMAKKFKEIMEMRQVNFHTIFLPSDLALVCARILCIDAPINLFYGIVKMYLFTCACFKTNAHKFEIWII